MDNTDSTTITGMLTRELSKAPEGNWSIEERIAYREHLLTMIDEREQQKAMQQRKKDQHSLMLRMFERLMWIFGYVVLTQMGVQIPLPGL